MPSFQIGIWRITSGLGATFLQRGQKIAQGARRLVDLVDEQRVRNARSARALEIGLQHGALPASGSHTTIAASMPGRTFSVSCKEFDSSRDNRGW